MVSELKVIKINNSKKYSLSYLLIINVNDAHWIPNYFNIVFISTIINFTYSLKLPFLDVKWSVCPPFNMIADRFSLFKDMTIYLHY